MRLESLLLSNEERWFVVAFKCLCLRGLLQDVHRHLVDLHRFGADPPPSCEGVALAEVSSSTSCCHGHQLRVSTELPPTVLRHFICTSHPVRASWPRPILSSLILVFLSTTLIVSSPSDVITGVLMEMSYYLVALSPPSSSLLPASSLSFGMSLLPPFCTSTGLLPC